MPNKRAGGWQGIVGGHGRITKILLTGWEGALNELGGWKTPLNLYFFGF